MNYQLYKLFFLLKNYNFEKGVSEFNNFQNLNYNEKIKYQEKKINQLLQNAFTKTKFYLNYKDRSFEDLPIVTKSDMKKSENFFSTNEKVYRFASTSGSTGTPLIFPRSIQAFFNSQVSYFCFLRNFGVNRFDRNIYVGGLRQKDFKSVLKSKFYSLILAQKKYSAFDFSKDEHIIYFLEKLNKTKSNISYISGFSQTLYHIAKKMNSLKIKIEKNLKLVHPNAEAISFSQKKIISKAFNVEKTPMVYGSTECHIASECSRNIMHINMSNCFVETINNELILTVFDTFAHPFIRYKIGDYGKLQKNYSCECGIESDVLLSLEGRTSERLIIEDKIITHPMINMLIQQFDSKNDIIAYQLFHEKGFLVLNIHSENSRFDTYTFKNKLVYSLNIDNCNVLLNKPFIYDDNGKRKVIINE